MAYLLQIHRRKCRDCSSFATFVLRNRFNEDMDWYCGKHGEKARSHLEAVERNGV